MFDGDGANPGLALLVARSDGNVALTALDFLIV